MITKKYSVLILLFLCSTTLLYSMCPMRRLASLIAPEIANAKILKLGGSVITDKSAPVGVARINVIDCIAQQIALYGHPIILVHGTGSFGHPLYHAYNLENEFNLEGTIPTTFMSNDPLVIQKV